MIIKKILVFFICSIVPYISKGQCLDSLKSVCLPDSIAEQIENNYKDKYTNASKNVVNLISPNNYNFVDGIYAFKGMGPHFPRQIFVYKREKIFIFNSRGNYNPEGVIMEFCSCIKKLNLTHKEIVDYLNVICLYLQEEGVTDYGDTIKKQKYNSVETNLRFHGIVQYPMLSSSVQSAKSFWAFSPFQPYS